MTPLRHPTIAAVLVGAALVAWSGAARSQNYRFPSADEHYGYFYPTAYKDHAGVDWNCGDIRYDGHQGSDFGGGSWEGMAAGRNIVAAARGVVTYTHDGEFDQCSTGDCPGGDGYGNQVWLVHPDGKHTVYGHMKQGTVAVTVGQYVDCGDFLGQMGSSGHSTGPHVHFGVLGLDGAFEDPFDGPCSGPPSYWVDQGNYGELPSLDCAPPPPVCAPVGVVTCGAELTARNDQAGSTDEHAYYGCGTEWVYDGPEVAYRFVTDRDEPVVIALTGLSADLSLHVLASDACDAHDCVGYSDESATANETATFDATAGHEYLVVVDGFKGATTDFTMNISCDGKLPEPPAGGAGGAGGTGLGGQPGVGGAAAAAGGSDGLGGAGAASGEASDAGCSCRVGQGGPSTPSWSALVLVGWALGWGRARKAFCRRQVRAAL
ncbi:MAG: M23 family metallopeptidase [Polyangiaceae bacterium]